MRARRDPISDYRLHELKICNNILYCSDAGWVDESLIDPTLRAWLDPLHNSVVRRIKHFSGYMVAAANSDMGGFGDASYWLLPIECSNRLLQLPAPVFPIENRPVAPSPSSGYIIAVG